MKCELHTIRNSEAKQILFFVVVSVGNVLWVMFCNAYGAIYRFDCIRCRHIRSHIRYVTIGTLSISV